MIGGMMSLNNKTAIVTGGNSGIGQAIVLELARQGARGVIDYLFHPEATEALEKQIVKLGSQAIGVKADVSKLADLQKLVDAAVSKFGRLDIMVNNAGIETRTSVLDTTEAQYDEVMAINLKSAFFGTQIAAKQARQALCSRRRSCRYPRSRLYSEWNLLIVLAHRGSLSPVSRIGVGP